MPLRLILARENDSEECFLPLGLSGESIQSLAAKAKKTLGGLCGGIGRCTTCKVEILSGASAISRLSREEKEFRNRGLLLDNERLACQSCVENGTQEIVVKYLF
ncbi:MAG: 2Fe-2S iron-sulfur cluster-binding protein [Chloroherpetonaceae bacterium]|nr:2Fe-2S iron-sulfur cluster-binding protein [Chloroherpetonaceae bacterium]